MKNYICFLLPLISTVIFAQRPIVRLEIEPKVIVIGEPITITVKSNIEGEIINKIHEVGFDFDGIIINAGAYTHTSVAIRDAISAITCKVVEVHISNTYAREEFRHQSYLSAKCKGVIVGFGMDSYRLAVESFV